MKLKKGELNRQAHIIVASTLKQIRATTPVISEQNSILNDWKQLLSNNSHRLESKATPEFLARLKEETMASITTFATEKTIDIEEELARQTARNDLTWDLIRTVQQHVCLISARRHISCMKKILAAGAAVGLFYTAYQLLKDGEKVESVIKRAQEKLRQDQAKKDQSEQNQAKPQ